MIRFGILFTGTASAHIVLIFVRSAPIIIASSTTAPMITFSTGNKVTTVISSNPGTAILAINPQAKMIWDGVCGGFMQVLDSVNYPCGYDISFIIHPTAGVQFQNETSSWMTGDLAYTISASAMVSSCGINSK